MPSEPLDADTQQLGSTTQAAGQRPACFTSLRFSRSHCATAPKTPMPDLYPLLLQPQFHERVWGTRDLRPFYSREVEGGPIGEAWLTGDSCSVVNGPLAGRTLSDLAQEFGARFLGDAGKVATRFPLL